MRTPLVATLTSLVVGGFVAAAPAPAGAALAGDQEIAALNGQRAMNGIPGDIAENVDWSLGCARHMAYLRQNGQFQHDEDPALPGYTVEGAAAGNSSVLTSGGSSFDAAGRNAFQHAPIHLMQMLNPLLKTSGAADGCLATLRDIARQVPAVTTYSYPGDGGIALTQEKAYESPFVPGDFVGLPYPATTGPHLYFFAARPGANAYWNSQGQITAATLTRQGAGGGPVAVKTVDNTTVGQAGTPVAGQKLGPYLSPGGIVIPVAPLVENATYTATVDFAFSKSGTVSRTWSFTAKRTLPLPTVPPPTRAPLSLAPITPLVLPVTVPSSDTPAVTAPSDVPVVAPSPAPVPVTSPTPAGGAATPADAMPVALTQLKLTARTLRLRASRAATLWVTTERRQRTGRGSKAKTTWKRGASFSMQARAGTVVTVDHKRLAKGDYRVTVRLGGSRGAVQLVKAAKVR